jgi:hypothetical protein
MDGGWGFIGFDPLPNIAEPLTGILSNLVRCSHALKSSLMSAIRGFGLYPTTVASLASKDVDLLLMTEEYYLTLGKSSLSDRMVPLVLLSSSMESDNHRMSSDGGSISYMSQPFSPTCVVKALNSCLAFKNSDGNIGSTDGPDKVNFVIPDCEAGKLAIELEDSAAASTILDLDHNPSGIIKILDYGAKVLLVEDNAINLKVLVE